MAILPPHYSKKAKKNLWGIDVRIADGAGKKRRVRVYAFETRRQAEEALAIIRRREKEERFGLPPAISRPSVAELIACRLPRIEGKAERTRAERVFRTLLEMLPEGLFIDQITTPHLQGYVDLRRAQGQSPASAKRELSIIASALHSADEYFPELAQWRAPKIPRPKVSKSQRERIIGDDEYRKICEWLTRPADELDAESRSNQENAYAARRRVAAIFRFAMQTGARPQEIFQLRWSAIDWDGGRIKIYGAKTDRTRYVPISAPVREILDDRRAAGPAQGFVFTKGGNPTPKIYRILRAAVEAVGIAYGRGEKDGFELYCARHTFITRLLQAGVDLPTVSAMVGHTARYMTLHYGHITPASIARAAAAIEQLEQSRFTSPASTLPPDQPPGPAPAASTRPALVNVLAGGRQAPEALDGPPAASISISSDSINANGRPC